MAQDSLLDGTTGPGRLDYADYRAFLPAAGFHQASEEAAMDLTVLAVPDCPNVMLQGRRDVTVSRQVIAEEDAAVSRGMYGSPTILVDGIDPFAEPGQPASV